MDDDALYQHQLALFSKCSTEKGIELIRIGMVIASLEERERFLDIGAGGGHLTVPLSQQFEKTSVIEPNPVQAAYLCRRCPDFTVYNESWLEAETGDERYDLVLCSHVLYYIPDDAWMETIAKMYRCLKPGGCLIIVLQSPLGEVANFFNGFTQYDVPIIELSREVIGRYGDDAVTLQYFQNEIYTESLEDMVQIGLFLLLDRKFHARAGEVAAYFEKHHKFGGGYRIRQDEILLAVRKLAGTGT